MGPSMIPEVGVFASSHCPKSIKPVTWISLQTSCVGKNWESFKSSWLEEFWWSRVSSSYCMCLSCSGNCEDVKAPERYFWNLWSLIHTLQKLGVILLPKLNIKIHDKLAAFRRNYSNEKNKNVINRPWHLHAAQDTETRGKTGQDLVETHSTQKR